VSRYPLVPLGDILELSIDEVAVEPETTYPIAGVYSFGRGLIARTPIVGADTKYAKLRRLRGGQLVFSRLNGWEGALAVVDVAHEGMFVSQEFPTFDIRPGVSTPGFVRLLARWPVLWDSMLRGARGIGAQTGARRLRINSDRLLDIKVPLPSLDEQARIVERMDRVSRVRLKGESARALSHALVQATLSTELGPSAEHPLVPLGDILELSIDEVAVEPETTYSIAGVYSFGRGLFARSPIVGADTKYPKLRRLHANQFVLSRLKAWEGAVAVVSRDFDGMYLSQEFPTFTIRDDVAIPDYVDLIARWPSLWASLLGQSQGIGARRDRVQPDQLLATRVPLPSLDEQARIVERMDRLTLVSGRTQDRANSLAALERATMSVSLGEMTATGVSD
jgi:type I restriction enzyme, S subunit